MSVDVVEQLRSLARSFDEFVGALNVDEVVGEEADDERPSRLWTQVAAAVIVLALIGGLAAIVRMRDTGAPADGDALSGTELADAIVNRVWVAIDYPLPQLPALRFSDGEGSAGLVVDGNDGCNSLFGQFQLDGTTVAASQVGSTAMACSTPRIAGMWDGTMMALDGGTLTVTDPTGTSTRWLPVDALSPIAPDELVGTYTMGTTPVTVTPESVVVEECTRAWAADGAALRFTGTPCSASVVSAFILMNAERWTSAAGDDRRVVVEVEDRFVRLDRTTLEAPARPGLASFLGAIGDRTWVFDAPASEYPLARRPSLRPPSSWTDDGDQLVTGHDGCNAYSLNGRWTPSGSGWQVAVTDGGGTSVDCGDRPTIAVENGSVLSLTSEGLLSVIAADGNEYLFRDIRAATLTDLLQSPLADLPRRWELDPGFVLEVKLGTSPEGRGVITMGSCGVDWWPVGNEWIGAGPVPQDCVAPADSPSAGSLLQLLDTGPGSDPAVPTVERPITVGINPERNVLYLADADGTIVLRLTRLDADPTPTTGAGDGDVIVEDALGPGAWTGAQTSADGSTLLLFFVGAAEYRIGDPCTARYVATVTESATEVRVAIHSGQPARPDGAVDGCRSIGYSRSLTVELAQPFGDRDLVVLGEPRSVFDGSTLARPKWIPDGWEDGPEQPAGIGPDLAAWSRSWAPPHPEPIDGACVPGSSGFLLFEGSASIVDALPLEVGETEAGTYDVNGSNATFSTQPDLGVTRLTWTSDERGYVLKSSPTCVGDEPPDLDTMLRFARELLP